jgi:uncharacterized protein YggE
LSQAGLQAALERAEAQAQLIADHALLDLRDQPVSNATPITARPISTRPSRP